MPNPGNVTKYVVSGALPSGEVWACGMYGAPLSPTVSMQDAATQVVTSGNFTGLLNAIRAQCNTGTTFTRLTMYRYPAGSAVATDMGSASLNLAGQSSTFLPNQTAIVTTLRTAVATGRGRGRCYWPCTGTQFGASALMQSNIAQGIADAMGTWIRSISGVVVSEADSLARPVTSVTVDNRTDVIRARAGRMAGVLRFTGTV